MILIWCRSVRIIGELWLGFGGFVLYEINVVVDIFNILDFLFTIYQLFTL
jgi:uncharacterized membrane protein